MAATPYDAPGLGQQFGGQPTARQRIQARLSAMGGGAFGGGLGLLVIAVGLLVIGIGWNGAAGGGGQINHVTDLRAQLPWLLSGGILGLALVVFGAALVVVNNARKDRALLEAKLDQLIDTMARTATVAIPGAAPVAVATTTKATANMVVAGGTAFHRPDCRLVQGRDDLALVTVAQAKADNLRPCRICKP